MHKIGCYRSILQQKLRLASRRSWFTFSRVNYSNVSFDDLRITPMNSSMNTYVYDPLTFKLIATLDDNNFATFYRRDNQGQLVLVKKETEKGIVTIQSTRSNVVK